MTQKRLFYFVKIGWTVAIGLMGCQPESDQPIPATKGVVSLVSVLPTGAERAEILVKHSPALTEADWQLTAQTDAGAPVSLSAAQPATGTGALAVTYQATGLVAGRTYRLTLTYRTGKQSVALERTYQHPATATSPWKRLAFLPVEEGNFTGQLYSASTEYVYLPNRFVRPGEAHFWEYYRTGNTWQPSRFKWSVSPRQGMIFFQLDYADEPQYSKPAFFYGLGYVSDDRLPEKRAYLNDFNEGGNPIPYDFPGEQGEVVAFTAANQRYLLTQNGTVRCIRMW
ncbi:MAG: hypothetical protein LH606_20955 [Cytophagaceae bacterium]|nr:hypothetical protein [Cytophagaceae bacterium]